MSWEGRWLAVVFGDSKKTSTTLQCIVLYCIIVLQGTK